MTELPQLPEPTAKKLAIQWKMLLISHGLTASELALEERVAEDLRNEGFGLFGSFSLSSSASALAKEWFSAQAEEYFQLWSTSRGSETFEHCLGVLKERVTKDVASLLVGRSDWFIKKHRDWVSAVDRALVTESKGYVRRTLQAELRAIDPRQGADEKPTDQGARIVGLAEATEAETTESRTDELASTEPRSADGSARRAAVDAYIEDVLNQTGKRITRTDIWKMARYKSRTELERWERNDLKRPNKTATQRFTRILTEKPHLK